MGYVEEVLQPEEIVRFRSNVHWFVYLNALIALLIAVGLLAWYFADGTGSPFLLIGALAFGVSAVILAIPAGLKRLGTEVAVTDRRVIYKTGFIWRDTTEMHMDKVESVDVKQSVLGRILNYGDVEIRGVGTGFEPLRRIDAPIELRNHITAV
jgi:uncharacterized membrane protein YdbT with pleckstrin-like domain